jgi:hypothetical protein
MLTLQRFRTMAESYGADLRRWPEPVRGDARALLSASPQARAILDDATIVDDVIGTASAREQRVAEIASGGEEAMLARLRLGVQARITAAAAHRPAWRHSVWTRAWRADWAPASQLCWLGLATCGGLAVAAGLVFGAMTASPPASDPLLSMLLPDPIHMLAD